MTSFDYNRIFDACVLGSGWAGFAAARALLAAGRSVLLLDPAFALLHEGGRAGLQARGEFEDADWRAWLAELDRRGGLDPERIDPAVAEICAARWALDQDQRLAVLSQVHVVAVERDAAGLLTAAAVATKAGAIRIAARRWIDASDHASLAALVDPGLRAQRRAPATREHALWLQHRDWPQVGAVELPQLAPGLALRLEPTTFPTQRRGVIVATDPALDPGAHEAAALAALRAALPEAVRDAVVSHVSSWPLARFDAGPGADDPAPNLALAVPALDAAPCTSCADRFALGRRAADRLADQPAADPAADAPLPTIHHTPRRCGVLVAGAGTGGAIAAIAAAEHGAQVIALDPQPLPGGIGTAGLIQGYCAGAEGGIHQAIDAEAHERKPSYGEPRRYRGWHGVAKGRALAERLAAAGGELVAGALAYGVEREGRRIVAVLAATADGPLRIACDALIDATGDGDLCAAAGCEAAYGRPGDGTVLAFTQSANRIVVESDGHLTTRYTNYDADWCDPTDPGDYSRARLVGTAQFLRERYADETLRATNLAPVLGLRQSRQIACDATLELDDLATAPVRADSIGPVRAYMDSHSVDFEFEGDEMIAWQWLMRAFRTPIGCDLPYGVIVPRDLDNAWIACRAAGFSPTAAYCARMQKDVQRLGEAAGTAAALAPNGLARQVDITELQARLRATGALADLPQPKLAAAGVEGGLDALAAGRREAGLWFLLRDPATHRDAVVATLEGGGEPGFVAACLLALWGDAHAEAPLLAAIAERRWGPEREAHQNGGFGQIVIVPDWLLALTLLRRCGSAASLDALAAVAAQDELYHDIRCMVALSLEGILQRHELPAQRVDAILAALTRDRAPDVVDDPSRSLWLRLRGEPQKPMGNGQGADTSADHGWQLELVVTRIRARLTTAV